MHQLETELRAVEMELSSQLEARKQRLEQMRTESTSLEKENEKLKRDMRDLVIEKQVLADNIPSAMMVGDTNVGEDANRGCSDGNRSCTTAVSVHQGVSAATGAHNSSGHKPENHGAHDPGTEEALRNLEAQVKEMRKTVQEQETNLHTVHGYVTVAVHPHTYCWRRTKRHTPDTCCLHFLTVALFSNGNCRMAADSLTRPAAPESIHTTCTNCIHNLSTLDKILTLAVSNMTAVSSKSSVIGFACRW